MIEETKAPSGIIELKVEEHNPIQHKTPFIPDGHRIVGVVGRPSTGKSTYLYRTFVPNMADAGICYICSKDLGDEPYIKMQKYLEDHGTTVMRRNKIDLQELSDLAPRFKEYPHNIAIFDDFTRQEMDQLVDFSKSGRHTHNCSQIYVGHSFVSGIPIEIRLNLNTIIVFNTDDTNHIANQTLGVPREIKKYIKEATSLPWGCVTIWKDSILDPALRVRRGLSGLLREEVPADIMISLMQKRMIK